jgi:hypothetical protein
MLILEPLEAALARGAQPIAEIAGFGMSADATHIIQPSQAGAERAMRAALRDAGLQPQDLGYINAHGTATEANDSTEVAAIRAVFGEHADRLAISSTKSMHGHTLGAAGAMEAAVTAFALRDRVLALTMNFTAVGLACDDRAGVGAHRRGRRRDGIRTAARHRRPNAMPPFAPSPAPESRRRSRAKRPAERPRSLGDGRFLRHRPCLRFTAGEPRISSLWNNASRSEQRRLSFCHAAPGRDR